MTKMTKVVKIGKNDQKLKKMTKNGQKLSKMTTMVKNSKYGQNGRKW